MKFVTAPIIAVLLISGMAQAAETGTTIKPDSLMDAPYADASVVATLPASSRVEIIKKDGGWYQIKSPQGSGWIRLLSVRKGGAAPVRGDLSGLAALSSGRAGTGKIVSTTGIRGLNEEQLKAARYDAKQLTLADSFTSSRADAQKFAAGAKLAPRQIDYLQETSK